MPIQRQRFQQPPSRSPAAPKDLRVVSVGPYKGMDRFQPPTAMSPAYSPDALNFEIDGGWLKVRTNVQNIAPTTGSNCPSDSGKSWAVKGALNHNGYTHLSYMTVDGSSGTLYVGAIPDTDTFNFSSVKTATGVFVEAVGVSIDVTAGRPVNMVICADGQNDTSAGTWTRDSCFIFGSAKPVAFFQVPTSSYYQNPSGFSLIPYTFHYSFSSGIRYGAAINERLVLYGLDTNNRIAWSVRGRPRDLTGEGAGFVDLAAQGTPKGIVTDGDRVVFITTDEIWEGRSRGDTYAFDFKRLAGEGTAFYNTFIQTEFGPAWLGNNQQLFVLRGSEIVPIAPGVSKLLRERGDISSGYFYLSYDVARRDLILFWYDQLGARGGMDSFFRIDIDHCLAGEDAWTTHKIASGHMGATAGQSSTAGFSTFNATPGTKDAYLGVLYNASAESNTFVFSLADAPGTYSSTYSECGIRTQAYWTTPVLSRNDLEQETIAGLWLDYQSRVTSVASILASTDGQSFTTIGALTMTPTSYNANNHRPRSQYSTAYAPLTTGPYRTPQMRLVVNGDAANTRIGPMRIMLKSYTGKF